MANDILKSIPKTFMEDLAQRIISVQPMDINMAKTIHNMQILIYDDMNQYNSLISHSTNIIIFKAIRDDVARMITETAVECKINIEMQKTSFNTWRVLCEHDIFQTTFKLKYG